MLEANGLTAFGKGADFAEVCKKWHLPPPPAPHPLDPARIGISPIAHGAQTAAMRSVPKQQPTDRFSPPEEIRVKPQVQDGPESAASTTTQAGPLSEGQRSWQTDIESTLVGDTKQVFSRDQVLPMTFHVLPGSSQSSVEMLIMVSPTIMYWTKSWLDSIEEEA